jgi:hypothetical protein
MCEDDRVPGTFLNAKATACSDIPSLVTGVPGMETTSATATSQYYYKGEMALWESFRKEVKQWFRSADVQAKFNRCRQVAVWVDPDMKSHNPYIITEEHGQIGAEISMSSRFDAHVLDPVLKASLTMDNQGRPGGAPPGVPDRTFGDSYIVNRISRPKDLIPDVVLKRLGERGSEVRLVGELKFFVTIDLEEKFKQAQSRRTEQDFRNLRAIFGQIIQYMVEYGTRYGFISTYNTTIFFKMSYSDSANTKPRIYYSELVNHSEKMANAYADDNLTISLRLALLFLTEGCISATEQKWRIPAKDRDILKEGVLKVKSSAEGNSEPMDVRNDPSGMLGGGYDDDEPPQGTQAAPRKVKQAHSSYSRSSSIPIDYCRRAAEIAQTPAPTLDNSHPNPSSLKASPSERSRRRAMSITRGPDSGPNTPQGTNQEEEYTTEELLRRTEGLSLEGGVVNPHETASGNQPRAPGGKRGA